MLERLGPRVSLLCLLAIGGAAAPRAQGVAAEGSPTALIQRFLAPDEHPLVSYRALRRLAASTRGGQMQATIEAWTMLDPIHSFSFEVVSESGSAIIRSRVLLAALEAEQQAIASTARDQAAFTPANYEFLDATDTPINLVRVVVRPRRKHIMLVNGALFLEPGTADLVRIEGELSRRPSFWTRRVRVLREYERIEGVHVPVAMSSTAEVLMVGSSSFSMTYQYVEINGKPIEQR